MVWTKLTKLNLSSNQIGDEGATAIAANKWWTNLKYLYLINNLIGYKEGIALGRNVSWNSLEMIELSNSEGMKAEEKKALQSNPLFGSKISFDDDL